MADEDDYMSDIFVQPSEDDKPKNSFGDWRKRKLGIKNEKDIKEEEAKRPRSIKVLQQETREKGLATSIGQDNLGFKLMSKMGYKKGEGLGKSKTGRVEPIPIVVKESRSGLGKDTEKKEKIEKKLKAHLAAQKARKKFQHVFQQNFQSRMRDQYRNQTFEKDLYKSQKVCYQLDSDNDLMKPLSSYFWPTSVTESFEKKDDTDFYDNDYDSLVEEDTELCAQEKLIHLTSYLRNTYFYCLWCAVKYTDNGDLLNNCPGTTSADHDD